MTEAQAVEIAAGRLRAGAVCSIWEAGQRYAYAELIERLYREKCEAEGALHARLRAIGLDAEPAHMIGQEGE